MENTQRAAATPPALIRSLHARYEASVEEFNRVDVAELGLGGDKLAAFRHRDAKNASEAERDILRLAILYQVPVSWDDALILQFHIHIMQDLVANAQGAAPAQDKDALETAVETLFDFMCCEVETDHGEIGTQFQSSANRAFSRRRLRTGSVGGAE